MKIHTLAPFLSLVLISTVLLVGFALFLNVGTQSGEAAHCGSYTTESMCGSYADCHWDLATQQCYDNPNQEPVQQAQQNCGSGYHLDTDVNYCVADGSAKVVGFATDSSGAPVPNAWIDVHTENWSVSRGGGTDPNGRYVVANIPAGSYFIGANPPSGTDLLGPTAIPVTLASSQILTQNISFIKATKTVTGSIKRADGRVITDGTVAAWQKSNQGRHVETQTDSSGNFKLLMGGGYWEVEARPMSDTADWAYGESPMSVQFAEDTTIEIKTLNFTVITTDAAVTGKVVKPDGTALTEGSVWVNINSETGRGFGRGVDANGLFKIPVSAGTYNVFIYSNDPLYVGPTVAPISVASAQTFDLGTLTLIKASKTVTGKVTRADGSPVTDANVNAWQKDSGANANTRTNTLGNYTLIVPGGFWEISVYPMSSTANWNYNQPPQTVSFANDTTPETKTVNFTVVTTDVKIKGKVVKPDGAALPEGKTNISFNAKDGFGFGAPISSTGAFEASVSAGTYEIFIWVDDPLYSAPSIPAVTVSSGQTLDLGVITLVKATKIITGQVTRKDGSPVTDAGINAWQQGTNHYANGETDASGKYTLNVTGGFWEISVYPMSSTANWNYNQPPQSVMFADDATTETKTVNFQVASTDAVLTGKVVKPDGTAFAEGQVSIDFFSSEGFGFGGSVDKTGMFRIGVSAGTYDMSIWSQDRSFTSPALPKITVATGVTKDIGLITMVKGTKVIKGKVVRADGRAVADARVGAFRPSTQTWIDVEVDSSGRYTLLVTGGAWEVSVYPSSSMPDWTYIDPPKFATFSEDATAEERILDFTVVTANATLTGKILLPDGTPPPAKQVFVNVWQSEGHGSGGPVDSGGTFRIALVPGTYNVGVHSEVTKYAVPPIPPVTLVSGETKDLGTIQLITKGDHIKGKVSDQSGKGIGGIRIDSWVPEGGFDFSSGITDASGNYDLLVTPGTWEVYAFVEDPTLNYYNPDPPKRVTVQAGLTAQVNFTLLVADAGISGTVVDAQGNVLTNLYGHAELSKSTSLEELGFEGFGGPGTGGPIDRGSFSFKAPAGTYEVRVFLPPDASYTAGPPQTVTLVQGQTVNVKVTVLKNNSVISGRLVDANGSPITGFKGQVFASSGNGIWQEAQFDYLTGSYTLRVSAGTWYLGYHIDPASGYLSGEDRRIEVSIADGQTITQNLVAVKADAKITGKVTDPTGKGVPYVFVDVTRLSYSGEFDFATLESNFVGGGKTDEGGNYTIPVPAGTYFVHVYTPPRLGYIAPPEQKLTIITGATVMLNLQLLNADVKIVGKVFAGDVPVPDAFVWGWSEHGGYREVTSQSNGSYEMFVSESDVWHLAGAAQINGVFYKANEAIVSVGTDEVTQDIHLTKFATLATSAFKTSDATVPVVVQSSDGMNIVAPANSISTSGSVTMSITPDTRVSSQGSTKVIGVAYEVEARDAAGVKVIDLNSDVNVSIPYNEADVTAIGGKEEDLVLSFWDEAAGKWQMIQASVVDIKGNVVTGAVDHFTRFAIISAADVTPPSAPANVVAEALGAGQIKLTWTNPASDFSHAKVYRSTSAGQLGNVRGNDITTGAYTDTGMTDGTTYYYTVRAVDPAGNESQNTAQVAMTAVGTSEQIATEPVVTTGIVDGDLIKTAASFDIYIVKFIGVKQFKRLILNPAIFNSYGHLSWDNVKTVSQAVQDSYTLSELVLAVNEDGSVADPKVYRVSSALNSDVGMKQWLNMTVAQFEAESRDWDAIYKINHTEASPDFYPEGTPITSSL